ncbi:MAG: hypothetical protein J6Y82_03610 [Bacteroidales bacterium]|nr:hypothetical protein [Bacteroidales bacterium]
MKSTVKVADLELFKHIDSRVAIIVTDSVAGFNGVLHVFMNNKTLSAWLAEKRTEYPDLDFKYVEDFLGTAVAFIIDNNFDGLSVHSVVETSFDVSRDDLLPFAPLVDNFKLLTKFNHGKMSVAELALQMRDTKIYFIGSIPPKGEIMTKKEMVFGLTLIKRKTHDEEYEALAAFLTPESALAFADKAVPVSSCALSGFAAFAGIFGPIVIEPQRSFSVEFSPIAFL